MLKLLTATVYTQEKVMVACDFHLCNIHLKNQSSNLELFNSHLLLFLFIF